MTRGKNHHNVIFVGKLQRLRHDDLPEALNRYITSEMTHGFVSPSDISSQHSNTEKYNSATLPI
jgi:hypothetical protein